MAISISDAEKDIRIKFGPQVDIDHPRTVKVKNLLFAKFKTAAAAGLALNFQPYFGCQ